MIRSVGGHTPEDDEPDPLLQLLYHVQPFDVTVAVEQVVSLLMLRSICEEDAIMRRLDRRYRSPLSARTDRGLWKDLVAAHDRDIVAQAQAALATLHTLPRLARPMRLALTGARLTIREPSVLRTILAFIDLLEPDAERLFFQDLTNYIPRVESYFRTPPHIIDVLVALTEPRIGERVCDPACGAGSLLVAAFAAMTAGAVLGEPDWSLLERFGLSGIVDDPIAMRLAAANLYFNGVETANLWLESNPRCDTGKYDLVLTDLTLQNGVGRLQWILRHVAPDGRAGVVIPHDAINDGDGLVFAVREQLLRSCRIEGVITLPARAYAPYSNVRTSIVLFSRKPARDRAWTYDVRADGYSLDGRRLPVAHNDLPKMLERWRERDIDPDELVPLTELVAPSMRARGAATGETALIELIGAVLSCESEIDAMLAQLWMQPMAVMSWRALESLCKIHARSPRLHRKAGPAAADDIPWLRVEDLTSSRVSLTRDRVSAEEVEAAGAALVPPGSIVVSRYGVLGGAAIVTCRMALSRSIIGVELREPETLDREYLWLYLSHAIASDAAEHHGSPVIDEARLRSKSVPISPLDEQAGLVRSIAEFDRAIERGRDAMRAIACLRTTVQHRWFGMNHQPDTATVRLQLIVESMAFGLGKTHMGDAAQRCQYVNANALAFGRIDVQIVSFVNADPADAARHRLRPDDLLISTRNVKSDVLDFAVCDRRVAQESFICADDVLRVRLRDGIDVRLLAAALGAPSVVDHFKRILSDLPPKHPSIVRALLDVPIPAPPHHDQRLFIAESERLRRIHRAQASAETSLLALRRTALASAFSQGAIVHIAAFAQIVAETRARSARLIRQLDRWQKALSRRSGSRQGYEITSIAKRP